MYAIFIQVFNLIYLTVLKLCALDGNGNFEIWWFHRKDLVQIYQNIQYFKFKKYVSIYKKSFLMWKMKFFRFFFAFFFQISSKIWRFYKLWWLCRKNHVKIYQTISSFYSIKCFNSIKKGFIFSKKKRNSGK